MKITIRKVRNKDSYVVKEDGKLIEEFETKDKAIEFFNNYKEAKNSNLKVVEPKVEKHNVVKNK